MLKYLEKYQIKSIKGGNKHISWKNSKISGKFCACAENILKLVAKTSFLKNHLDFTKKHKNISGKNKLQTLEDSLGRKQRAFLF